MSQFEAYLKAVLDRAEREATDDRSPTIEAEHVLLAVSAEDGTDAQRVLHSAGLDHAALKNALHREFERSLGAAGVSLDAFDLPPATVDPSHRPQPGSWFRPAMERTVAAGRGRTDLTSSDLLVGILQIQNGTVPRTLALAGVDRTDLIERARTER